jgi:hypothetical protein
MSEEKDESAGSSTKQESLLPDHITLQQPDGPGAFAQAR